MASTDRGYPGNETAPRAGGQENTDTAIIADKSAADQGTSHLTAGTRTTDRAAARLLARELAALLPSRYARRYADLQQAMAALLGGGL